MTADDLRVTRKAAAAMLNGLRAKNPRRRRYWFRQCRRWSAKLDSRRRWWRSPRYPLLAGLLRFWAAEKYVPGGSGLFFPGGRRRGKTVAAAAVRAAVGGLWREWGWRHDAPGSLNADQVSVAARVLRETLKGSEMGQNIGAEYVAIDSFSGGSKAETSRKNTENR